MQLALCDDGDFKDDDGIPEQPQSNQDGGSAQEQGEGSASQRQVGPDGAPDWAAINAAYRRDASKWLASSPFGHIVLQRLLMEPLRVLLRDQFHVSSGDWEKEQRRAAAQAHGRGEFAATRRYRMSIAAMGDSEKKFNKQISLLWRNAAMASVFPDECYTVAFRSLAFRCISRTQCSAHQLLWKTHHAYPAKLFALLEDPSRASEMAMDPECMMDKWSLKMRSLHPTLDGDVFQHRLALCALLHWKDIASIEARHASIRRLLTCRPTDSPLASWRRAGFLTGQVQE